MRGVVSAGMDGTYLLDKREKLLPSLPYTNLIGIFTFTAISASSGKHNASSATRTTISTSRSRRFSGRLQELRIAPRRRGPTIIRVSDYIIYNLSPHRNRRRAGPATHRDIKNLFDRDPPFAITYDSNTGAGSSWEPRVADPRGRSFTFAAEVKF